MLPAPFRIGLQIPRFSLPGTAPDQLLDRLTAIAQTAEASGFDSLWVMDHLYQISNQGPEDDWMLEGNVALAALAGRTSRLHLGLMVGGVTYRNPALLAKMTTSLDVLSGGRAVLGIGAAWFEGEHLAFGYEFPPILNRPRPIRGDIPILVGGSGERKTLRVVARYADASNVFGNVERVRHLVGVLERHCEDVGRDPAEITKTQLGALVIAPTHEAAHAKLAAMERRPGTPLVGDPDGVSEQAAEYLAAGLDGLIVNMPDVHDLESVALAGRALARAIG